MRPISYGDIISFHEGRADLLVLDADSKFSHIKYDDVANGRAEAYFGIELSDGSTATVLLERKTIDDGQWFPDALDDNGDLIPGYAMDMADIINNDTLREIAINRAVDAFGEWRTSEQETNRLAMARARTVVDVVAFCKGSQTEAARRLDLDQSTVNRLVKKAQAATE